MTIVHPQKLSSQVRAKLLNETSTFVENLPESPEKDSIRKSLVKKLKPVTSDPQLAEKALSTFLETEIKCLQTNRKIRSYLAKNEFFADSEILHLAARKIDKILGAFPIEEMISKGRFGPGSSFLCRGEDVSRARKFSLTDVSPEFEKYARGLLAEYPLWACGLADADLPVCPMLTPVPGGRFSTVPKDSTTDRSIMIEPTINSWFQQGVGAMIRSRLKRVGVDLDDQSLNQRLAQLGSLTDDLATVDLSSASDLISIELVRFLVPSEWFFWLDITRSKRVRIKGEWVELQKFSSMGNGFTFDLESLIFYALAWAVTVKEGFNPFWVNTFGDDIVIPSGCYSSLVSLFDSIGFAVNLSKSFSKGPFRESCGKDYHLGKDIRGVYIKDFRTDFDLMRLHNRM